MAYHSARKDRILLVGDKGTITFSVFDYKPIKLYTEQGVELFDVPNPPHVQQPLIENIVRTLQGTAQCDCDSLSATPTNWAMDRILGKF